MNEMQVGGPGCPECGEYYGDHRPDCPERKAVPSDDGDLQTVADRVRRWNPKAANSADDVNRHRADLRTLAYAWIVEHPKETP